MSVMKLYGNHRLLQRIEFQVLDNWVSLVKRNLIAKNISP